MSKTGQIEKNIRSLHRKVERGLASNDRVPTYAEIASLYHQLGASEEELEWLTKAHRILRRRPHASEERFLLLLRLIEVYRIFGSESAADKALGFIGEAIRDAIELERNDLLIRALHQKAFVLIASRTDHSSGLEPAEEVLNEMIVLNEHMGFEPEFRHVIYANLGIIAGKQHDEPRAKQFFDLALKHIPQNEKPERRSSILKSLAKFKFRLDNDAEGARELLDEALKLGSFQFSKHAILEELEEIAVFEHDHEKAYGLLKERIGLEREWNMQKAETKMTAMKVRSDLLDAKRKRKIFELENVKLAAANRKIAEKNRHITDSIIYSSRLQNAVLPNNDQLLESLGEHFLLYRPKDIVAGDFYWMGKNGDHTYFAIADCTGHGVPGALVSMTCFNALNQAVSGPVAPSTGIMLDTARDLIKTFFQTEVNGVRDGMDIALIRISNDRSEIQFSGAHNPLCLARNGELTVFAGDRQPVGNWVKETPFTTHQIEIQQGDRIFLYSDGYADQFGGPDNMKLKTGNFKNLLLETSTMNPQEQGSHLSTFFENWTEGYEQMDDVTVCGIHF